MNHEMKIAIDRKFLFLRCITSFVYDEAMAVKMYNVVHCTMHWMTGSINTEKVITPHMTVMQEVCSEIVFYIICGF